MLGSCDCWASACARLFQARVQGGVVEFRVLLTVRRIDTPNGPISECSGDFPKIRVFFDPTGRVHLVADVGQEGTRSPGKPTPYDPAPKQFDNNITLFYGSSCTNNGKGAQHPRDPSK
eukprot:67678-Prorocentrum_minimum.AAC.1